MNEQQYRVIADRDKGDYVYSIKREPFDRVTYGPLGHDIVRIERPLTKDERMNLVLDASAAQLEAEEHPVPEQNWEPLPVAGGLSPHEYSTVDGVVTIRRIERPVPATDEPRRVLMTHPHDGHGPDDTCLDCAAECGARHEHRDGHHDQPSPHGPTREQIAKTLFVARYGELESWDSWGTFARKPYFDMADAVLALIQNGADR